MTVAYLLANTVNAAVSRRGLSLVLKPEAHHISPPSTGIMLGQADLQQAT